METKLHFDFAPLMSEIFKIHALIDAYVSIKLSEEQQKEFNDVYLKRLKTVIKDFISDFPNAVTGADELLKQLED